MIHARHGAPPSRRVPFAVVLLLTLSSAACATPEQVNCPDKYEGQVVTVAGKITKTASFLGLATLSTIEDAKGGVCVVITKTGIGDEGGSVRLEQMLAIHDDKTIVPNFLRRASENVPAGTAAGVTIAPAPTPTPDAPIIKKIGAAATYVDGWKVTVTKAEEQPPARFSSPKPGNRLLTITVRYDNGTAKEGSFNGFDWKVQDTNGVRHDQSFFGDRNDKLNSGTLAAGGFVVGTITFEVPATDQNLSALYTGFTYKLATWELY